jgi:hypothetical protein
MNRMLLAVGLFATSLSFAKASYTLACQMKGTTAVVYACNSGNSAEGNNHYVTVQACEGTSCVDDYDLMYIYASSGSCEEVGSISFSDKKDFCLASFRP